MIVQAALKAAGALASAGDATNGSSAITTTAVAVNDQVRRF
jgi:hypothetical protein